MYTFTQAHISCLTRTDTLSRAHAHTHIHTHYHTHRHRHTLTDVQNYTRTYEHLLQGGEVS